MMNNNVSPSYKTTQAILRIESIYYDHVKIPDPVKPSEVYDAYGVESKGNWKLKFTNEFKLSDQILIIWTWEYS